MRCQIPGLVSAALVALLNFSSIQAGAQVPPADEANALIERGVDLRVEKRDAEALELFVKANQLAPSPRAVAQMGLAEQALGRWVEAERHLMRALSATDDPWIGKAREALEDGLRVVRSRLGSLQIEANVAGAEVLVNGQVVGTTPMNQPARVPAATAVIVVRAPHHVPVELRRELAAGDLVRETVTLVAEQQTGAAAQTATEARALPRSADTPAADTSADRSSGRTWGTISGGIGVAALAATGVLAGLSLQKTSGLSDSCKQSPNRYCTPAEGQDINRARDYALVANVTFATGLIGVGLGTWLLWGGGSERQSATRLRIEPEAGTGYGGLRAGGAF